MRGRPYYEEPEYHEYLLSRERRELFPADRLLSQLQWADVENLLDFGMGNGYFLPAFYRFIGEECQIWGAEAQEELIDEVLRLKVREDFDRFIPFYIERTEHPLLPDWIAPMDLIFCSCVLSTFADPALAIRGIGRSLKNDGRLVILDWEKIEAPSGPELAQKISKDRMTFFIEDAGYRITNSLRTNRYIYGLEIAKTEEQKEIDANYVKHDYESDD